MKMGRERNRVVAGAILIILGIMFLLPQFIEFDESLGLLVLPTLGLLFFAWGILTRQSGLFIPGGILTGLGIGTLLVSGPYEDAATNVHGAIFMLSFAFGWILIPIVSTIVTGDNHWWALIPGGIMGLIGASLLLGGAARWMLATASKIWPAVLILAGLYLLLRRSTDKSPS